MTEVKELTAEQMIETAVQAIAAKKGRQIVSLDLRGLSGVMDYFIICCGSNGPQIKAICDNIDDKLGELGVNPLRIEGYTEARWVLMDYGDIIVHIFNDEDRGYFNLERLWGDAKITHYEVD